MENFLYTHKFIHNSTI